MKKLFFIILSIASFVAINAQENEIKEDFKPGGKIFAKVYWNYHYDLTEGSEQRNNFELQRSYLGYQYSFSEAISTKITLDVGSNDAGSDYTAFLKTAQLDWEVADPLKITVGLMGMKQFDTQEKFWGYRYIFKSLQDEFAFGSSADLGVNAEISLSKMLKANLFILNGEGYKNLQDNMGRIKAGGNLIFEPIKGLILKAYYDNYGGNFEVEDPNTGEITIRDTINIQTIAFFAGYKTEKFRIGAEYNLQIDGKKYNQQAAGHDLSGIAVYSTFVINDKYEVFGQYLNFKSNKLEGETDTWNYNKDASVVIAGIQYKPVKGVCLAVNYKTFLFDNTEIMDISKIYLNFEYSF